MLAIQQLHALALGYASTPTDAYRLLVYAVADMAEMSTSTDDALTAAIAILRLWRDGDPVIEAALPEAVAIALLEPDPEGKP